MIKIVLVLLALAVPAYFIRLFMDGRKGRQEARRRRWLQGREIEERTVGNNEGWASANNRVNGKDEARKAAAEISPQ